MLNFTLYSGSPPLANNFQRELYPKRITVPRGKRIIWDSSKEAGINHLLTLKSLNSTFLLARRSPYFAYRFKEYGNYPFSCAIYPEMNGVISVV